MLSIANHQGNGNPNYGELSTSALLKRQLSEEKKKHPQNTKCWKEGREVGVLMHSWILEKTMSAKFLQKKNLRVQILCNATIPLLGTQENRKQILKEVFSVLCLLQHDSLCHEVQTT